MDSDTFARIRKKTRAVRVGGVTVGGGAPVSVQSMTSVPIEDVSATVEQITALSNAGADIVRLAVRNMEAIKYLRQVRSEVDVMLAADIHFNSDLAVEAIKAGVNKVRINPGNIGGKAAVREVVAAAKDQVVPIRIGVNGGSLDKRVYPAVTPQNLASSALDHVKILEELDFYDVIVSIKSSDVLQTIEANEIFSRARDYPLHIGLTEAGYGLSCITASSVLIGHLLLNGLGDTIRVSMTGDPVQEVFAGKRILEAIGERQPAVRIISCPTCGRTSPAVDLLSLAEKVETACAEHFGEKLKAEGRSITVAVMGCEVNGPGEASEADFGLAGSGKEHLLLFARGEKLKRVHKENAVHELCVAIDKDI